MLQEALADEAMNREAAQARLRMMEQAIPTLHEDLMKAQEQLVQARMEVLIARCAGLYTSC